MQSVIPEDRSKGAWIAQRGSMSGMRPDPPEYIATYRTQEKASREKTCVENIGRLQRECELGGVRYKASMKKWGLADSVACECGGPEQEAEVEVRKRPRNPKEPLIAVQAARENDPHSPSVQDRAQANPTAGRFQTGKFLVLTSAQPHPAH